MPLSPYELLLSKFSEFTEIQKLAIGPIEQGFNCLLTAPTGSGKTEAAILPVLNRIVKSKGTAGIFAIYITPLRALNRDLIKRLDWLGKELGISIAVRHGDTSQSERRKQTLNPPQLLITTPETIQNLFMSNNMKMALKNLKVVIVDELHELYYNKRGAQLSIALERLEEISKGFQRVGISATIGDIGEASNFLFAERERRIISSGIRKKIDIGIEMPERPKVDDKEFRLTFGLDLMAYARIVRVGELIRDSKATLVFANTRQAVESIGSKLIVMNKEHNFGGIGIHHSSIDREERIAVENAFKEGRIKALIATSSLELGIDVGEIDLVVQYGSPRQTTRLMQRVGRGGHREMRTSVGRIIVHNELDCLEAAAIAQSAMSLDLEKHKVERNALDVLANQICAMALDYKKIDKKHLLGIVRRSYLYSGMKDDTFEGVCNLLADLRLIKYDGKEISYMPKGRKYFYNAISVIPDSSRFLVKDAIENRIISTLDEEFVYNYVEAGSVFITKGLPWKVVSIDEDVIYVETSDDISAAVPDWDGEDIPVSYNIASRVWKYLEEGVEAKDFAIEASTKKSIESFLDDNNSYFRPKPGTIFVEELENSAIAYMAMGKRANEFLGRILSIIASSYAGGKVNAKATPYAVIFDYSSIVRRPDTMKILEALRNMDLENRKFVFDSELFRYKFVQAAKLFGVLDKKAPVTKGMVNKIISFYENTPIFDETARDLYKNYFDIDVARGIIDGLRSGKIKLERIKKSPSPLSKAILQSVYKYGELLSTPERNTVIDKMLDKFEGRSVKLACTFCGHVFNEKIGLKDGAKIYCHSCRSPLVVTDREKYEEIIRKRLAHKQFTKTEDAQYKEMMREASLVDAYGYRALVALSVYGIGIETATRLLKYIRSDYKMFFVDVLEAQKNFIRNRKFWKID